MNLRDRLRSMNAAGTRAEPRLEPDPPQHREPPLECTLASIPGARTLTTPYGEVVCIEHTYPLSRHRGRVPLDAAMHAPRVGWRRLLSTIEHAEGFAIEDAAFVDTETTGLERGTGTYAFLVGVGRLRGDVFSVRQFLMRDYHEEPALVHALLSELEDATSLVTYNGKSFDWPLLQTRAVLNRVTLPSLHHLDLVHPARRVWGAVTQNCRLTQLEDEILGTQRVGDVPGELIPYLFFQYLQTGQIDRLAPVVEHNRLDLLTTLALAGYLAQAAGDPLTARPTGEKLPGSDLYAFGRMFASSGETSQAILCLEEARRRQLPQHLVGPCCELLGTLYKRTGRFDCAVPLWLEMVESGALAPSPHIELAKYYEHHRKDLLLAREWTLKAMDSVLRRRVMRGLGKTPDGGKAGRQLSELAHRLNRLEARLRKQEGQTPDPSHPA